MKVVFVSWRALPLFDPSATFSYGGSEVRASLLARGLAERTPWSVELVAAAKGPPRCRQAGRLQVRTIPIPGFWPGLLCRTYNDVIDRTFRQRGFPWLGIRSWSWHLLWQVPWIAAVRSLGGRPWLFRPRVNPSSLRKIGDLGADVVCCFGVTRHAAELIDECHRRGQRVILFTTHDMELLGDASELRAIAEMPGQDVEPCARALATADAIVVQTRRQRELLERRFGRAGFLVRNPIDLSGSVPPQSSPRNYVLWIGRCEPEKQPQLLLEIAAQCPEIPFVMVLKAGNQQLRKTVGSACPANVRLIDNVPFADTGAYFAGAAALVNTAVAEGFPNTFLQAWKEGTPLLSLNVDPDGVLERTGSGCFARGDLDALVHDLQSLWSDRQSAQARGRAGRAYVEAHHEAGARVDELAAILSATSVKYAPAAIRSQPAALSHDAWLAEVPLI